ncbi:hypothetical protein NDI45_25455 [Leptolyngbya sp. GB1-A1]|uniref:hypothetical protein n=1 Tax=Leptolyngbya sp. GB1-A1 TaxID=2933908 RepID=UPI0032999DEA
MRQQHWTLRQRCVFSAFPVCRKNSSICQWRKSGGSNRRGSSFFPPSMGTITIGRTGLVGKSGMVDRLVEWISGRDKYAFWVLTHFG